VVGVVEGGTDEVVHAGVGNDEGLGSVFLDDEDAGEERSGLGDDEAAGFEEKMSRLVGEALREGCGISLNLMGGVEGTVAVVDAEAASGVDVADVVAVFAEVGDKAGDSSQSCGEGIDLADLRADVDADACGIEPFGFGGLTVDGAGGFDVDAELVFAEAGGDVGVGLGEDVGINAEGEAGADVESFGAGGEEVEFGLGLDVEEKDVAFEGGIDLPYLLTYA